MRTLIIGAALTIFLGCAGVRAPNPVPVIQFGDDKKTCDTLAVEISHADAEITRLIQESDHSQENAAVAVVGILFLWPVLFALDNSTDEEVELNAMRQRRQQLILLANDKDCGPILSNPALRSSGG